MGTSINKILSLKNKNPLKVINSAGLIYCLVGALVIEMVVGFDSGE